MGSDNRFNSEETPYPPSKGVGDLVAVFQIVFVLAGNDGIAETAAF